MALAVLMFFSLVVFAKGEEKCYGDLGCFTNGGDYSAPPRLISIMPQSPDEINTTFLLFTRNNTDKYQVISAKNVTTIQQSNFNCSRNTVFIVHGYTETGKDPWPVEMCRTILKKDDVNCICVDWSGGSYAIYFQAINNCQVVGAEIAFFINTTMERFNCSLSGIHLIGHSLGGQVVGEAGKRRPDIAQITCLDAASPGFEGQSIVVRVDSTDAKFVMAIHTDGGPFGLGMKTLIGHMDFFPNGGKLQTGCQGSQLLNLDKAASLVGAVRDVALCNHVTSYYMYIEAILNPDGFMGYCASNYSSFQMGGSFPCSTNNCSLMGYFTKPGNTSSCRTYYLNTGPRYNYERYRYNVTVQTGGNGNIVGTISFTMYNSSNSSDKHDIKSGSVVGGRNYSALVDGRFLPPIARVTVSYNYIVPLLIKPDLWALTVTVTIGNDGSQYKFCADEATRDNNLQPLTPCP